METVHQEADSQPTSSEANTNESNGSEILFPESPVYEPEDIETREFKDEKFDNASDDNKIVLQSDSKEIQPSTLTKRKFTKDTVEYNAKIQKLELQGDEFTVSTQTLDDEVSKITSVGKRKRKALESPSTSRVHTPSRLTPKKISKRSNSVDSPVKPKTPKTPKSRSASVDITKAKKTPQTRKIVKNELASNDAIITLSAKSRSQHATVFKNELTPPDTKNIHETIEEENTSELNDSQNFHLVMSPVPEEESNIPTKPEYSSEPVVVKDRKENIDAGTIPKTRSEGFKYSDNKSSFINLSQLKSDYKGKTTDQESTDSVSSVGLESPDHVISVASKIISKLSNGNSSTPTELKQGKHGTTDDSDVTPDMAKLSSKLKRVKNESFHASNTTTPSTISPLQNGHSIPINTPQTPVFDFHINHTEDGEFLSLYVVKTDNDMGMKEYQRLSKRFTIDPYLGDVSMNTSPSSVTSGEMIKLPVRSSFVSTVSSTSTSSSNRTSDGAFVVPQPPRKSISNPTTSAKGYDALIKKLMDIFSQFRETSVDETNRSMNVEKISIGVQVSLDRCSSNASSLSNGNASPEEMNKCDKTTPKSSLKKSKVRGRRPLAGKTKRALLPTQVEEPEYVHGMNSPEMVPMNGNHNEKVSMKSPKEENVLTSIVTTPKSVSKLKQKRRPTSPRPATPVEKTILKPEYSGHAPDTVVLAKWVDKRYYSGKVLEITGPNKYLIKFDDGQSKTLLDDFIIFGDMKTLPLQGQSVYAMVDEEQNYEPGLVLGVEENDSGTVSYRCTTDGDTEVMVTASELYLTEDQARSLKESIRSHSPSTPSTPRRHNRELDLDNIIQGPRSARTRDKSGNSSARKRIPSPKSPKASTSGVKSKGAGGRKRLASESSELSESSNPPAGARPAIEEVAGVEPEVQRTPRKIDGVKAGPLQLKGAAKQNIGKKNSKLTKFENDEDTVLKLGPIPPPDSKLFSGQCFLLTCTDTPRVAMTLADDKQCQESRQYSSEEDQDHEGESSTTATGTDTEDLVFSHRPFNKERLKEQLETGGGTVYSHFDDVPKNKYVCCKLIAPRPCKTAKYIQCLAADIRALSHDWVIMSCIKNTQMDPDSFALPAGWSIMKKRYINWVPPSGQRNVNFFKDQLILLCGDGDTFVKFWERVCSLCGAGTRSLAEPDLEMELKREPRLSGALALVTEWDCPHELQNRANQDNVPLVSTHWVVQCLIETRVIPPTAHEKFSFMYTDAE